MGLLVGLGVIARFPLPRGGGGDGAFLGRGGAGWSELDGKESRGFEAPTNSHPRTPKSSGKPQQNRGADELLRSLEEEITVEFPGIFPLARIRGEGEGERGAEEEEEGRRRRSYFEII